MTIYDSYANYEIEETVLKPEPGKLCAPITGYVKFSDYELLREIAGAMAAILETRVPWGRAGEILNRYQEAIK
jgi:hypothetical protein